MVEEKKNDVKQNKMETVSSVISRNKGIQRVIKFFVLIVIP